MSTISFDMSKQSLFRYLRDNGAFDQYIQNFDGHNMKYLTFQQRTGAAALSTALATQAALPENQPPAATVLLPPVVYADPANPTVFEITTQASVSSVNEKIRINNESTRRREQKLRKEVFDAMNSVDKIKFHSALDLHSANLFELRHIHLEAYMTLEEHEKGQLLLDAKNKFTPTQNKNKELSIMQLVNQSIQEDNDIKDHAHDNDIPFYPHQQVDNLLSKYKPFFDDAIKQLYLTTADPTVAQITTCITNAAKAMDREGTWRSKTTNTTTVKPIKKKFEHYCWSHGPNNSHSPSQWFNNKALTNMMCKAANKPPDHNDEATFLDTKGGKTSPYNYKKIGGDHLGP